MMHYRNYTAIKLGFRSGLEMKVAEQLKELGIDAQYEAIRIPYKVPAVVRNYTPDYVLPNGIVIETKGRFTLEDRKKHLLIKEMYPALDIRFVFSNPLNNLRKGSTTTYADWCDKHGFLYAHRWVVAAWLEETLPTESRDVLQQFKNHKSSSRKAGTRGRK